MDHLDNVDCMCPACEATGTDLVVTHECPACRGVDKLSCTRCDGSGRVGNRTRAEQVEAFLAEEAEVEQFVANGEEVPNVRCPNCHYRWLATVGRHCPRCRADMGGVRVVERPTTIHMAKNRSGVKVGDVQAGDVQIIPAGEVAFSFSTKPRTGLSI